MMYESEERQGQYLAAVTAALETAEENAVNPADIGLRQICTECGQHVERMRASEREHHHLVELFETWILIGCEGYWFVDPAAVGLDRGGWQDWREIHCGDCAATLGEHCAECAECPWTVGPCWCGSTSYTGQGSPTLRKVAADKAIEIEVDPVLVEVAVTTAAGDCVYCGGALNKSPDGGHYESCPWVEGTGSEPAQIAPAAPSDRCTVEVLIDGEWVEEIGSPVFDHDRAIAHCVHLTYTLGQQSRITFHA